MWEVHLYTLDGTLIHTYACSTLHSAIWYERKQEANPKVDAQVYSTTDGHLAHDEDARRTGSPVTKNRN